MFEGPVDEKGNVEYCTGESQHDGVSIAILQHKHDDGEGDEDVSYECADRSYAWVMSASSNNLKQRASVAGSPNFQQRPSLVETVITFPLITSTELHHQQAYAL